MCVASFLPPVYLFMDAMYLPKCYMCLCGLAVCLVSASLLEMRYGATNILAGCQRTFLMLYPVVAMCECLYVLLCLEFKVMSEQWVNGTFDNPAGLSLSLCMALPVSICSFSKSRRVGLKWLHAVMCVCMVSVILLTKSRTGQLCLAMFVITMLYQWLHRRLKSKTVRTGAFLVVAALVFLSVSCIMMSRKADSTSGRYFILQQTIRIIGEHPLVGLGPGGFEREYMLRQADFFQVNQQSEYAMLADEVQHPLNEYMYLWVEYGIAAPVILLAVFVFAIWMGMREEHVRMTGFPLAVIAVAVFCLFSYPSRYPSSWLVAVLCMMSLLAMVSKGINGVARERLKKTIGYCSLIAGVVIACAVTVDSYYEMKWRRAYVESVHGNDDVALKKYETLEYYFRRDWRFHYSYSMAAFMAGDMMRAHAEIKECGLYWNGYNRELLAGDICLNMQKHEDAVKHYNLAAYMCPSRFAPLEGLYRIYDEQGLVVSRDSVADIIKRKRVKVYSSDVERIKGLGLH